MTCKVSFEDGSSELAQAPRSALSSSSLLSVAMQSAQILKWHLHKLLTHRTAASERQVSSAELPLVLDWQTPQDPEERERL